MVRPHNIKVGPHIYSVQEDLIARERGANAETYVYRSEIKVVDGLSPTQERQSLLHETLHALWHNTGLSTEGSDTVELEEAIVTSLAPGLLEMLRENPALVSYLLSDGED